MRCLLIIAVLASAAHADPKADAKKLVDEQIKVFKSGEDDKLRALFDPDAIVIGQRRREAGKDLSGGYFVPNMFGGSPHTQLKKLVLKSIAAAGGDAKVFWFTAELTASAHIPEPGFGARNETLTLRLTELVVGGKIVAAALDHAAVPEEWTNGDITGATEAGSLTAMLATPATTGAALAADGFAIGTDKGERAVGPAAKKLLGKWAKLELSVEGKPREVRTATWGFAQARIAWKQKKETVHMLGFVIATPKPDGTWTPIGVHYSASNL